MTKEISRTQKAVTRDILVKELSAFGRRLESRLNSRFESRLDSRLELQTESLKAYINNRFAQTNLRFEGIDKRFDGVDKRFDGVDKRFDGIDRRLDRLEVKVDKLDKKLDMRTAGLVELIERGFGKIGIVTTRVDDHEKRITVLESRS